MRTWADDFRTYEDACEFYGCDTPAQIAAEVEHDRQEAMIALQDELEAYGGPLAAAQASARQQDEWFQANVGRGLTDAERVDAVFPGSERPAPAEGKIYGPWDDSIPF